MDRSSETLDSIREINLSYIMLAQRMLREDKPIGMFRLGLSSELADLLAGKGRPLNPGLVTQVSEACTAS